MAVLEFSAFPTPEAFADAGVNDVVKCGWVAPEDRDRTGDAAHSAAQSTIPQFQLVGRFNDDATTARLWDCWSAAKVKWTGVRQVTGSCVGAGGGNGLFSLACADVFKRKDRERVEVPFWLLPYGISRMLGGLHDRGDGSFGSVFAQAIREYGHLSADMDGLPGYQQQDGFVWGQKAEYDWSVGRRIPADRLAESKKFLVRSTARCSSPDDVRDAIKNYYPCLCASNWGGQMRPAVTDGVLLNRRVTQWMHQMSIQGWMDHPRLGELFWIHNQWGIETHGRCPTGAPGGGFWVNRKDMADIVSQGETYALSQFDGFPALDEPLDFSAF